MKIFTCEYCAQLLFFENTKCEKCAHPLGYIFEDEKLAAMSAAGDAWQPVGDHRTHRYCANAVYGVCNWLVDAGSTEEYCFACRHNNTVPDTSVAKNVEQWKLFELAKHRLFYELQKLKLPLCTKDEDPVRGLAFDFLNDVAGKHVMTGHDEGLITIALSEADSAQRETRRQSLHEPFRTILGHFRHEVGHYFWDRLVRDGRQLEACRALFGDDKIDYAAALQQHYKDGPPSDWQSRFITAYASTHPWEDFAETWAHYLHIVDALDTARAFGLVVHPRASGDASLHADLAFNPYRAASIDELIEAWLPLTYAVNSLNQSLGQPNLYPFVLTPSAIQKLGFVHNLIRAADQRVTT